MSLHAINERPEKEHRGVECHKTGTKAGLQAGDAVLSCCFRVLDSEATAWDLLQYYT